MMAYINSCIASGDTIAAVHELQSLPVPPAPRRGWEVGCLLRFPKGGEVLYSNSQLPNGGSGHFPYVVVEVVYPDGYRQWDKAFLSTLVRVVKPMDRDNYISNRGTMVDYVRQFPNWDGAVHALAGKTVKVTSVDVVEVGLEGYFHRNTRLYGLDLV